MAAASERWTRFASTCSGSIREDVTGGTRLQSIRPQHLPELTDAVVKRCHRRLGRTPPPRGGRRGDRSRRRPGDRERGARATHAAVDPRARSGRSRPRPRAAREYSRILSVTGNLRAIEHASCPATGTRGDPRALKTRSRAAVSEPLVSRYRPVGGSSDRAGHDYFIGHVSLRGSVSWSPWRSPRRSPFHQVSRRRPRRSRLRRVAPRSDAEPAAGRSRDALEVSRALTGLAGPSSRFRSSTPSAAPSATAHLRPWRVTPVPLGVDVSAPNGARVYTTLSRTAYIHALHSTTIEIVERMAWSSAAGASFRHPPGPARRGVEARDRSIAEPYSHVHFSEKCLRALSQSSAVRRHGPVRRRHPAHHALGRGASTTCSSQRRTTRRRSQFRAPGRPAVMPALVRGASRLPAAASLSAGARRPTSGSRSRPRPSSTIWAQGTTQNHVRAPGQYKVVLDSSLAVPRAAIRSRSPCATRAATDRCSGSRSI